MMNSKASPVATVLRFVWLACSLGWVIGQQQVQYTVVNKCPSAIDLYIAGAKDSTLAQGASVTRTLGIVAGFFYTTANGGTTSGGSTRAGFFADTYNHYYIVKDSDHFNTGMSITPGQPAGNGICSPITCDSVSCNTAFNQPPSHIIPAPDGSPSSPPLYSCPLGAASYTITFCPSGSFPNDAGLASAVHPNYNPSKCMDVRGAIYQNGTPVQIYDCNGTGAQKWIFNRGSTKVRVAGTNFCLDAGSTPGNAVGMKIWTCYDNLPAQQWYFTEDNRIALENRGLCLDLTNGVLTNSNQLQTWQCTDNNLNQVWTR